MTLQEVSAIVEGALEALVVKQSALLDLDVSERALSHYLAIYLMGQFGETYDVDVEYNRHHDDPKRLNLSSRSTSDRDVRAVTVFPDIIIHKRGSDDRNLLVIEMKKPGGDLAYDRSKLEAFRRELAYEFAAHVIVGRVDGKVHRDVKWI